MRKNESSLTSLISPFARAYHSRYDTPLIFDDFIAKDLINEKEFPEISENMLQGTSLFSIDKEKHSSPSGSVLLFENAILIRNLFSHVPSGSSIVFDYADETLFTAKGTSNRVEHMVKMAAASGEPMKSCFTYDEIEKMLDSSGLLIHEHLSPADINGLFFGNRTDYLSAFEAIHYIHVVKK
ncbi:hypothetical protein K1Y82_08350 [Bacillus inaquosorum]|uniref:hypothetical protein n=1 Tax=Bacillus inaquosorum TaxID=483913 RepID=UPI001C73291E|nr:hypothetical protein [Bacillus inaquosorum]QYX44981.1 hypothetical protein K1Y82_08350 [Bacillus inaquosorum]WNW24695.1 hypothetical protein RS399_01930 [Bacillus inaquosorum]